MMRQFSEYSSWKGWESKAFGELDSRDAAYYQQEIQLRCGLDVAGTRVVELGFGNGGFAAWARKRGANYIGIEMLPDLVERGRAAGFAVFLGDGPLDERVGAGSADTIVAFDVFEHVSPDDIRALLQQCFDCLKPGGRLVARVPSGDSPFARGLQYGDMTHRTILGSSAVTQLAGEVGFEVKRIGEPAFPWMVGDFAAFLRRVLIATCRRLAYPVITRAFMGGGRPVLTPNMVFELVKP